MEMQTPMEPLGPLGVGTEMEYAHLIARSRDSRGRLEMRTPPADLAANIFRNYAPEDLARTGVDNMTRRFIEGLHRIYEDCGHPEVANALAWNLRDAQSQFRSGHRIITEAYANAARPTEQRRVPYIDGSKLSLRLVSSEGLTWAYHINLLMDRRRIRDPEQPRKVDWSKFQLLAGRLATSYYNDGAGGFYLGNYHYGQKSATLGVDYDSYTQSKDNNRESKPLVNQRDQPHADEARFMRLHVVSQDALILPKAFHRQLGATMLTAIAIQEGLEYDSEMLPRDPFFRVGKMVADDLTMQRLIRLDNGKSVHPHNIEQSVLERIGQLEDRLDPEMRHVLELWRDAFNRMERVRKAGQGKTGMAAVEAVHTAAIDELPDVVWARKLWHMHNDFEKNPHKYAGTRNYADLLRTARWAGVDGLYDRIDTSTSFGVQDSQLPEHAAYLPSDEEVEAARIGTLLTGRQAQISEFIAAYGGADHTMVGWHYAVAHGKRYNLLDPYARDPELDRLLQEQRVTNAVARYL